MKFFAFALVLLFAVIVSAKPAGKNACQKACAFDYKPVCAGPESGSDKPLSFGNTCVLENYNCENKKNFVVKSQGECPGAGGIRLQ